MLDAFTDGRRFRVLAVVDDFSRECRALVADTSLSGLRVTRELDALLAIRGRPATIVSDNGTELTSMAVLKWCQQSVSGVLTPPFADEVEGAMFRAWRAWTYDDFKAYA